MGIPLLVFRYYDFFFSAGESTVDVADVDFIIEDEIPLDPKHLNRVHEELEKLNIATDVINKLELQLDEARATFRFVFFLVYYFYFA